MVIGISFLDSLTDRQNNKRPLCRVHFSSVSGNEICITEVVSCVNEDYEETRTVIVDGCVDYYVGIDELDNGGVTLQLFPNPMEDHTTLMMNNAFGTDITVSLMDPTGRSVRDYGTVKADKLNISKDGLSAGVYFVQVTSDNRILNRERLVVR
jgi:hypothetical protein